MRRLRMEVGCGAGNTVRAILCAPMLSSTITTRFPLMFSVMGENFLSTPKSRILVVARKEAEETQS
jgi:hypothetical protein